MHRGRDHVRGVHGVAGAGGVERCACIRIAFLRFVPILKDELMKWITDYAFVDMGRDLNTYHTAGSGAGDTAADRVAGCCGGPGLTPTVGCCAGAVSCSADEGGTNAEERARETRDFNEWVGTCSPCCVSHRIYTCLD